MRAGRFFIHDRRLEAAAGGFLFVAGAMLLHDAFERRGRPMPAVLRPFTFW